MNHYTPLFLMLAVPLGCGFPPPLVDCVDTCGTTQVAVSSSSSSSGAASSSGAEAEGSTGSGDTEASSGTDTGTEGGSTTGGSSGTSSMGESSSTGAGPVCGDGVVDSESEECDEGEGDPQGACVLCQRARIIFVSSVLVNGKMSGLQGADAYCRSQALKAQQADPLSPIVEPKNFKALLPSSKETIFDRHFAGKGPYRLVNGVTVSDSFAQLFSEPLQAPINVDEFSQTHVGSVWTASLVNGEPYPGVDFCGDWTSVKGSASKGRSEFTDAWWIEVSTEVAGQPTEHCAYDWALYCLEQQ